MFEFLNGMDEIAKNAILLLGGGVGVKAIDRLFDAFGANRERGFNDSVAQRQEMRAEIAALRKEVAEWQGKFFSREIEIAHLTVAISELKADHSQCQRDVREMRLQIEALLDHNKK